MKNGPLQSAGSRLGTQRKVIAAPAAISVEVNSVGVKVGPAANARLYRGYCEQRRGDYEREYRIHGGKETLTRIGLLTR